MTLFSRSQSCFQYFRGFLSRDTFKDLGTFSMITLIILIVVAFSLSGSTSRSQRKFFDFGVSFCDRRHFFINLKIKAFFECSFLSKIAVWAIFKRSTPDFFRPLTKARDNRDQDQSQTLFTEITPHLQKLRSRHTPT